MSLVTHCIKELLAPREPSLLVGFLSIIQSVISFFTFRSVISIREDRCNFYEFERQSFSDFLESIDYVTLIP